MTHSLKKSEENKLIIICTTTTIYGQVFAGKNSFRIDKG